MKVALLTAQNRVSPVFETTQTCLLIEATPDRCEINKKHHFKTNNELEMTNELLNKNVEILICGAISHHLEKTLINQGCEVFGFISGEIDDVIDAFNLNKLNTEKFTMPGCEIRKQKRGKKDFSQNEAL